MTRSLEQIDLRRVVVVGTSCSGKTTLSRALAARLGSRHIEMDALHWQPDWREKPHDELRREVEALTQAQRWVLDGNYGMVRDIVWPRATAILWWIIKTHGRWPREYREFFDDDARAVEFRHPDEVERFLAQLDAPISE